MENHVNSIRAFFIQTSEPIVAIKKGNSVKSDKGSNVMDILLDVYRLRSTLWSTSVSRRGASMNESIPRIREFFEIRSVLRLGIIKPGMFPGEFVQRPRGQLKDSMEIFVKVGIVKMECHTWSLKTGSTPSGVD